MDLHSFFLLFPSIFMLHELEEILLFPRFMDRNPQLQRRLLSGAFTSFRINAIIYQEFILLLIILGLSVYFESFDFYLTIIIAYIYITWSGMYFKAYSCDSIYRVFSAVLSRPVIVLAESMMRYRQIIGFWRIRL